MARGGSREGQPGKAYQNRRDLQGVKAVPGRAYGERKAIEDAQRAVPLPNSSGPPPAPPAVSAPAAGGGPLPGVMPFDRQTERPGEPVTTGLPMGAGGGPETLTTAGPAVDAIGAQLRALYATNPNNDILRLIELHDQGY